MNIEYFQEFAELARRLNYREAAARLNMSQSALSKHVKAIETEYGIRLFDRDRQSVALTPAGAMLVEYAQQIWDAYEKSHAVASASRASRPIVMAGLVESPEEHHVMSEVMHYVSGRGITRQVRMRGGGSMEEGALFASLDDGQIDCIVSYDLMERDGRDGVCVTRLRDVPLDVIVSTGNALASKRSLRFSDMAGGTFIHLAGPHFTPIWRIIEQRLSAGGVPYLVKPTPTSSIYDYVNMDLGNCLLVMPRKQSLAKASELYSGLKVIPVSEPSFKLGLDVAFLEGARDESLDCLIEALAHCYNEVA